LVKKKKKKLSFFFFLSSPRFLVLDLQSPFAIQEVERRDDKLQVFNDKILAQNDTTKRQFKDAMGKAERIPVSA